MLHKRAWQYVVIGALIALHGQIAHGVELLIRDRVMCLPCGSDVLGIKAAGLLRSGDPLGVAAGRRSALLGYANVPQLSGNGARSAPAGRFRFDLGSDRSVRVLVSKSGPEPYPSRLQTGDGEIRVEGTVIDRGGRPLAGRMVYFKLIDPPDEAPYVARHGDAWPDDNVDGPGALDDGIPNAAALSGADGRVDVILRTTRWAAGDNYQLEASTNHEFACEGGCPRSAVYTAWKRVYLENDAMFRRGSFVGGPEPLPPGRGSIPVTDIRPFIGQEGARLVLIHSGPFLHSTAFWSETHELRGVVPEQAGVGGTLILGSDGDPTVTRFPYDPASAYGEGTPSFLGDAVGLVTGATLNPRDDVEGRDFFFADDGYLNALFNPAFVEYVAYPDPVPWLPALPLMENDARVRILLSEKWFKGRGLPNHQHLLGVSEEPCELGRCTMAWGRTRAAGGIDYSYVYVGSIEARARVVDPHELVREVVTHEVAHQWHVDPQVRPEIPEHDDALQWDREGMRCQMAANVTCPNGKACPDLYDGHVGFHYESRGGRVDSEYLWIRDRCDPIPVDYPSITEPSETRSTPCR